MSQYLEPHGFGPVQPEAPPPPKRRIAIPLVVAAAVVAVLLGAGAALLSYNRGISVSDAHHAAQPTPTVTQEVTVTESTTVTETETATLTVEPEKPDTYSLTGSLELTGSDNWVTTADGGCEGDLGYNDLSQGAPVTVYSGDTTFAGAGFIGAGEIKDTTCVFNVEIDDIVGGSNVYLVEVSHRGKLKAELFGDLLFFGGTIGD